MQFQTSKKSGIAKRNVLYQHILLNSKEKVNEEPSPTNLYDASSDYNFPFFTLPLRKTVKVKVSESEYKTLTGYSFQSQGYQLKIPLKYHE